MSAENQTQQVSRAISPAPFLHFHTSVKDHFKWLDSPHVHAAFIILVEFYKNNTPDNLIFGKRNMLDCSAEFSIKGLPEALNFL